MSSSSKNLLGSGISHRDRQSDLPWKIILKNDAELRTSRHDVKPAPSLLNPVSCGCLFGLILIISLI